MNKSLCPSDSYCRDTSISVLVEKERKVVDANKLLRNILLHMFQV